MNDELTARARNLEKWLRSKSYLQDARTVKALLDVIAAQRRLLADKGSSA